jgi:hypothetical protein
VTAGLATFANERLDRVAASRGRCSNAQHVAQGRWDLGASHARGVSGRPDVVVLGREVQLGTGYADLVAIERDGRVVVIELKLARNPEARRAASQVLGYASRLHGLTVNDFERVLEPHLRHRQWTTIVEALEATDQEGSFDREDFLTSLEANLAEGGFRLVIVLDAAPEDLVLGRTISRERISRPPKSTTT